MKLSQDLIPTVIAKSVIVEKLAKHRQKIKASKKR